MNESKNIDYLTCLFKSLPAQSNSSTFQDTLPEDPQLWIKQLRAQAIDEAGQLKWPTNKDEEWRFTDISPLTRLPFKPAQAGYVPDLSEVRPFFIEEMVNRLVFVNGFFAPELSSITHENQLIIGNLDTLATSHAHVISAHLGQYAQFRQNLFTALNTAFLHDGAIIIAPRNTVVDQPIHLLFVATQAETTHYPRCLIVGDDNSQMTVVEDYVALQADKSSAYITNSVTELKLSANAQIQHIRLQRENLNAFHLANCAVSLDHASRYETISISLGAKISRYNLNVSLNAKAAECAIDGLALITDGQLADTHTCIDHVKPNCTSHQQHKCIVDNDAHAVFNGKIIVRPNAQKTNSSQSSRNLLLSNKAQIDTKPQLEIFADDVKCAHGATVGQLDKDEIFYLKSRGLSELAARNLLTYAFGAEILNNIPIPSLKHTLEQTVLNQTQSH
ncbi:Fe-S cluster assembly protein SufD [Nitrosomonas sp.]|uniref:Fe-S cluster assembly protein SufD n=1 Tax=Nitrosomonas sp. TaxID=42353 RepID=UPI00283B3BEA|nr:Fe-S cluster assembly protein SufD [Nitrosomonas sp.]MCP5242302.1 Fe-S cluster assembly protein SufD [Burkholderiales bacterium]MDR4514781.1 Fe-S cluster assembly protein SufD [Nitrosomonas sp.]